MYLKNEWGEVIYEDAVEKREIPVFDSKSKKAETKTETFCVQRPKINPKYDKNKVYTPRSQRKEWAAVGLIGQMIVRDDGTCRPDGYCAPNSKGVATASPSGYRVLERVYKDKIRILLK